jgi:hypothetical protein
MKPSHKPKGPQGKVDPAKRSGKPSVGAAATASLPVPPADENREGKADMFPFHGKRLL